MNHVPQQNSNGQYEVVPPITAVPNTGSSGHNPYEFIVASTAGQTRTRFGLGLASGSFLMRLGLILGGVIVLAITAAILVSIFAPKGSTPGLTQAAEQQEEIIRVSGLATKQVTGQDAGNFVANVNITIASSQQQVIAYLGNHGVKIPPKTLALSKNSQTDMLLANAASAGNYDSVVAQTLADEIKTYQNLLHTTYQQTSSPQAKQLLQSSFNSANTLLKQYQLLSSNS